MNRRNSKRSPKSDAVVLAGAKVVVSKAAPAVAQLAAGELSRYLHLLTGRPSPIVARLPASGTAIVLNGRTCRSLVQDRGCCACQLFGRVKF